MADKTHQTPMRNIRIPDHVWHAAKIAADDTGTSVSEICRRLLAWWVRQPGARLPQRPPRGEDT